MSLPSRVIDKLYYGDSEVLPEEYENVDHSEAPEVVIVVVEVNEGSGVAAAQSVASCTTRKEK